MSDIAIRVENLSKLYHIGKAQRRHDTLRDTLADGLRSTRRWLRRTEQSADSEGEDALWALKNISLEVKRGEVLGIIGRNGAGKSTLLKILSRITEPTAGRVVGYGRVGSLLEVGTGFHPELTGRENIYLNGAMLGMRRVEIDRKFDEIVAFSEVERFLDTPVKRYSSGMYVRLAFAVAAHLEPEILIVDEVLAVGDAAFQKKCLGKMGDVASEGRTVLFVSHTMPTVLSLCSRVVVLQNGRLQFNGGCEQGVTEYQQSGELSSGAASIPLDHLPRIPHRPALLTHLRITNSRGAPTSYLQIGEAINLQIDLSLSHRLDNIGVGVGIENYLGMRVTTATTRLQNIQLSHLEGRQTIECSISDIKLTPGRYGLKLAVNNGNEEIDSLEIHNVFTILESDFWGGGKLPNLTQGSVLINAAWRLIP
jgi:lipopolysaccharide transport system ATP-binding protein